MKSKMKRRMLAIVLCMVIVLSNSSFIFASSESGTPAVETVGTGETAAQTETDTQVPETTTEVTTQSVAEPTPAPTEEPTVPTSEEPTATPEPTQAPTATPEPTETDTTVSEPTATPEPTQEPAAEEETQEVTTTPEPTQTPENEITDTVRPTATPTPTETPDELDQTNPLPFEGTYEDDTVEIHVSAEAGIVPEGAELSVTPIEKTEITDDMNAEDKAKAEKINAQYDLTEKKLTEDSEENEETMQGFLAYDISFLVNGEEVEPNGDVKVVMDFREAAIPEGVSEDTDVAVKHLKTDDDAVDGIVVEDMAEKATIQTTDSSEVEKVEFTSDSFSTFTLYWSNLNTLTVQVVDEKGKPIGESNNKNGYKFNVNNHRIGVDAIANKIKDECDVTEDFNRAVYVKAEEEFSFSAQRVYGIYNDGAGYKYCIQEDYSENSGWYDIGNGTIYFIFGDDPALETTPVPTVSTEDTISINLFDYQVNLDGNEKASWDNDSGINQSHALKFVDTKGEDKQTINIKQSGASGKINSDMVERVLGDGFPILKTWGQGDGKSLNYLFDLTAAEYKKSVYSDLDYLFRIDKDGYHVFNSDENYAYLPCSNGSFSKDFKVVNINGQTNKGFYPFSQPSYDTLADIKNSSEDAVLGYTGVNHYYGMTIETTFIQPKGGQITTTNGDTQNMIFEFSGDDDVWVFIDDVLVLDLGGIHGKVSGTINFATGAVTRTDINGGSASGTTIREAFNAANVDGDLKADTNTFSDYSTHTIKFFYLERGNVDSNCMIKFNFPTIPKDSVTIAKEVTDEDGTGIDYADDIDFKFNIKVGNENYKNQQYALWENGKQVLDEQGNPVTGTTDDEGNFTLKHSQMAVFSGLNADTKYQVTELGAYLNGYTVYIDGTEHEVISDTSSGQSVPSAQTRELIVGEDKDVIFRNEIKNRATLSIKKELKEGEQATDEPFQIQVKIQGNLYNGTYSIGSQSGLHANNGIISLKAGETATITGIPYGANFEVEEMLNGTYQPSYSVNGDVTNISVPDQDEDENTVTSASAQIIGEAANVTITNKKLEQGAGTTNVAVEKNWDMTNGTYDYPEYITVTLYKDVNHDGKLDDGDEKVAGQSPIQLSETNGWKGGWTNLPGDTDFVVKEEYPEGYQIKTTEIVNDITDMSYIDVVTNCNNLIWNLKQNNMLVTKKGNNFIVWTIYDLKLTNEEKTQVKDWIAPYVNGNIGSIDFVYGQGGFGENSDITLVQNDDGSWRLEFGAKSTWSQFYYFSYNRTQNITLTNEIISDHKTNVTVTKVWSDGNPNNFSVEVQLLQNGKPYMVEESPATVTLPVNGNDWTYTFTDLPYFSQSSDGKWIINEYTVVETKIGDVSVVNNYANGYISKVTGSMQSGFTITNSRTTPWQIFKVSSVDKTLKLSGAEFKLESTQAEGAESTTVKTYWGRSDSSGVIIWYSDSDFTSGNEVDYIPDDTYTLTETKAPVGYSVSDENWTITISSGNVMILNSDGAVQGENVDGTLTFYYKNTALYSLPSTGSSGIFGYMMGGTLLLMAGTLILYKMKRKEVQES